ncbi:zinc-binding dehydrogenase [Williamsia sp. CHRR-6]|uniref:zinc-binding dehydrogenase n=1 Tax=Williamsia sp. CHRR-6 TaxID=2835871 RepID=UPI001BDAD317|nr:zinc-binding dehydrogenase [Williamsia sp. CHRR-6]MBT0567125.1 zinc-binding dehydrogenase [Williamsia sp. CHRR-6]
MNKKWLFHSAGEDLELVEGPDLTAGPDEVVIDVKAVGLCHSDVGVIETPGQFTAYSPIVLGHEIAGVVREVGANVTGVEVGDRIGNGLIAHPIGANTTGAPGTTRDGGYQQQAIVPASEIIKLPDGVSFAEGASATDSVATAYHAVKVEGQVGPGSVVGIVGLGGLGMSAVQIAKLLGARVYGADINEKACARAEELGADGTYASAAELAVHQPEVIFDFAGVGDTTADAIKAVGVGGKVVLIGLSNLTVTLDAHAMILGYKSLLTSLGTGKDEITQVYDLIDQGKIEMTIEEIGFDEIPAGLKRLSAGGVVGRLVATS